MAAASSATTMMNVSMGDTFDFSGVRSQAGASRAGIGRPGQEGVMIKISARSAEKLDRWVEARSLCAGLSRGVEQSSVAAVVESVGQSQ